MTEQTEPWYVHEESDGFRLAELAVHALLSHKAEAVVVLDLRGLSDVADFFVIATGSSEVQVESLGRGVRDDLVEAGHKPAHLEGFTASKWILLDYGDVIVHVLQPRARNYYRLEHLWSDAGVCPVDETYFTRPEVAARHPELPLVHRAAAAAAKPEEES